MVRAVALGLAACSIRNSSAVFLASETIGATNSTIRSPARSTVRDSGRSTRAVFAIWAMAAT
jgi:hypothetical protein